HNAKFELAWLRRHAGIDPDFAWDTLLAARLLRPDLDAGLKAVAERELDAPAGGPAAGPARAGPSPYRPAAPRPGAAATPPPPRPPTGSGRPAPWPAAGR